MEELFQIQLWILKLTKLVHLQIYIFTMTNTS